jgi:hypothetical protein
MDDLGGFLLPSLSSMYTNKQIPFDYLQAKMITPIMQVNKLEGLFALHSSNPNVYQKSYFKFES